MAVSFKGDQKMEQFLNSWDSMLAGMKSKPTDNVIEALFLKQLRKSQVLKEEISHYDRTDRSDPTGHKSYALLYKSVKKYLEGRKHESNRDAYTRALVDSGAKPPALALEHKKRERKSRAEEDPRDLTEASHLVETPARTLLQAIASLEMTASTPTVDAAAPAIAPTPPEASPSPPTVLTAARAPAPVAISPVRAERKRTRTPHASSSSGATASLATNAAWPIRPAKKAPKPLQHQPKRLTAKRKITRPQLPAFSPLA